MEKVGNNYSLVGKLMSCMFQRKEARIHNKNLRKKRWFNVHLTDSLNVTLVFLDRNNPHFMYKTITLLLSVSSVGNM